MSNCSVKSGVLDYVSKFRGCLHQVRSMAKEALLHAQGRMKSHYDQKAVLREFKSCQCLAQRFQLVFMGPMSLKVRSTSWIM